MLSARFPLAARVVALSAAVAFPLAALAAAPMAKTQAPGFQRVMLGAFELTALSDGALDVDVDKVLNQPPAKTDAALAKAFLKSPVETSVNAFLVNTGAKLVLIDTGTGGNFGPTAGALVANLKAAGYAPEQVDDVFITHMHGDHVGGLSRNGEPVFPNAVVHAGKGDIDHYLSHEAMDKAAADEKGGYKTAMTQFGPYDAAHRLLAVEGAVEVVPGIRAWPTPGHTPGHTSYVVESQGHRLVVTGDLIHVAAVQLDDPAVTVVFDADPKAATAQRAKVFAQAAKDGDLVAASHLPFPGIGHLRANGKAWTWVPLNYSPSAR